MRAFKLSSILFLWLTSLTLQAQFSDIEVQSYISKDTVVIGEPFVYSLSINYPSQYEVFFPDSQYFKTPIEWINKTYSNTVCKDNICTDSVQYTLRTFSTDSILSPNIPVFIFIDNFHDTLFIHPEEKQIVVKKLNTATEDYQWKENVEYLEVYDSINYWYYGLITLVILFVVFILYMIAGPYIIKRIKLFNLTINHKRFIIEYDALLQLFSSQKKPSDLEKGVTLWKSYLTKLESKPYTTLTTKELEELPGMDDIIIPLQNLDRYLYGGLSKTENSESLNALRRFSNKRFLTKKIELRNARKV